MAVLFTLSDKNLNFTSPYRLFDLK